MITACTIRLESTVVELSAYPFLQRWLWSMRVLNGPTLQEGHSSTQGAAQSAAQRAFEIRLARAQLTRFIPDAYPWRQKLDSGVRFGLSPSL